MADETITYETITYIVDGKRVDADGNLAPEPKKATGRAAAKGDDKAADDETSA